MSRTDLFTMVDIDNRIGESSTTSQPDMKANMPLNATGSLQPTIPKFFQITKSRPTRESVLKRLSEALMRRSLTMIDLSQRSLCASDARLVKMALLQNARLATLKLSYNNLGDEGVKTLAFGIAAHKALVSLDLSFNRIGDEGCRGLAEALGGSCLHSLSLAGNLLGGEGSLALADVIRGGCALQKLHLTGNRLGSEGVTAITEAVVEEQVNRTHFQNSDSAQSGISELFLGGTSMGPPGCHAVGRMLESTTTICVISLMNCSVGDDEVAVLAASIKANRERLPIKTLQLSFNQITCKGLDSLTNAIWGSQTLQELFLDNNEIGDRGGQQIANILPHVKTLEVVDVGFNLIKAYGMKTLMKVVAQTQHLVSLSVSGNPIDTGTAKAVAYALAYNRSLRSIFLDHCSIEHEGQRHIVAGFVSNSHIGLRKFTGFRIGPVIVTIGLPAALEHWTNEQVLNFIHLMWEKSSQSADEKTEERELDPLHFLPDPSAKPGRALGPLDATTVVDVAKRAFESLGENGDDVFSSRARTEPPFECPVTVDAIMIEADGETKTDQSFESRAVGAEKPEEVVSHTEIWLTCTAKSFVATPSEPAQPTVPDPARKKRIVDWLCLNIQHLNELSQLAFESGELWRLHQHYFAPVVNESGGDAGVSFNQSDDRLERIVNSVPEVGRGCAADGNQGTPSTQSSDEQISVPLSDPSLPASPAGNGLSMLKRKVSYRFLGDAVLHHRNHDPRQSDAPVAKMIEDGTVGNFMAPKNKRARRNKTRISFLPRIKAKIDSHLDICHEKALILMRQLLFVERALLSGRVNPCENCPKTHLAGILASEAEMILVDMM